MGCGLKFCSEICSVDGRRTPAGNGADFFTCSTSAPCLAAAIRAHELNLEMDRIENTVETLETIVDDEDTLETVVDTRLDVEIEEHLNMRQELDE
jgi:hypothetical protein